MHLPEKDVMIDLDEVKNTPYSTEIHIFKVHMAKRVITKTGFQSLQLYQIASYKEPFYDHDEWYHRKDGSDSCGHFNLSFQAFIQTKAVRNVLKRKLGTAGYNFHAVLIGAKNNVFMTKFDSFYFWFKFLCRMDILVF